MKRSGQDQAFSRRRKQLLSDRDPIPIKPSATGPNQSGGQEDQRLLLSVREVADLVGLSERTVWKLSGCGELPPPIKIGRSVRWLRRILEDFMADRQKEAEKALKRCAKGG
jgi:predicted DNA-binding transcriptional regulator AlpA